MASTTVEVAARPNFLMAMRRNGVGPYLFIAVLTVLMYFVLGPRQFVNALTIGAIYALVALGYTMVYGIIELINFAHGDVFMVGAFVSLFVLTNVLGQTGSATSIGQVVYVLAITFALTMTIVGVLGVLIERFAYRPLRNAPRLAPLITAIGISFILQNLVQIIYGPSPVNTPQVIPPSARVEIAGVSIGWVNIFIIATAVVLMIGLQLFVSRTKMGRAMRSTASDREAAALMGVDINRTIAVTFLIGSALAGAAGVVQGLYFGNIQFTLGFQSGLKAFTAAVLGGIGNLAGAAIGGFFIGFVEVTAANFGFFVWAQAAVFMILIVTLVFRPAGLFGQQLGERA
jgi:branched-chain amino acid transport system permease protein